MWFIGVEVEQEMSAPPLKKILDPPLGYCIAVIAKTSYYLSLFHLFFIPKYSKSNVPIVIIHTRRCLQIRRRAFQVLIPFFKSFLDFKSLLGIVQLQAIHV